MAQIPSMLPYRFQLSLSLNETPADVSDNLTNNVHSAFRLTDDLLTEFVYDEKPVGFDGRLKNLGLRLLPTLLTTFLNHEEGHLKTEPVFGKYDAADLKSRFPFYDVTYPAGGLVQSYNLGNLVFDESPMVGANYSLTLLYVMLKSDRLLQDYIDNLRMFVGLEPYSNPETDVKEIKKHIACARTGEGCKEGEENTSKDAGYDLETNAGGTLLHLGNVYHLIDPIFLWSIYQLVAGDGTPAPGHLPQFQYLETPDGPSFGARMRFPFLKDEETGRYEAVVTSGANFIWNNELKGQNGFGLEVGMNNVPTLNNHLFLDFLYQMVSTPREGAVANLKCAARFPVSNQVDAVAGGAYKFGDGFIPGAQFFQGSSILLGIALNPSFLK